MQQIFEQICNMSIWASWLILAVLAVRFLIKKAPKKYACLLWFLVGIRLVFPFSVESNLSLVPSVDVSNFSQESMIFDDMEEALQASTDHGENRQDTAGVQVYQPVENVENQTTKIPIKSRLPYLWITGVGIMLIYFIGSSLYLKRKLFSAVRLRENVYQSEYVASPFVYGIIRPKIYVPFYMQEESLDYVLLHEKIHIRRHDHWTKVAAFFILCIYWFHPLVWLSYALLCKDIEMACDEQVIAKMDEENRKSYSMALLTCHGKRTWYHVCPVGFGEANVKERVIRVKYYQKPSFWIIIICVFLCIAVAVCFLTNRIDQSKTDAPSQTETMESNLPTVANKQILDRYGATIHFPLTEEVKEMLFKDQTMYHDGHPIVIKEILEDDGQYELIFEFLYIEKDGTYSFVSPFMSSEGLAVNDESGEHLNIIYTFNGEEHIRTQHWSSLQYVENGIRVGYQLFNSTEEIEAVKQGTEIEMRVEFPKLYQQVWTDEGEVKSENDSAPVIRPVQWTYSPMMSATWHGFFQFYFEMGKEYTHIEATCDRGTLVNIGSDGTIESNPERFEYSQINWTLDLTDDKYQDMSVEPANIHLKVYNREELLYSDTIEILCTGSENGQVFYEAKTVGTGGLTLEQLEDNMGAMVVPTERVGLVLSADLKHDGTNVDVFVYEQVSDYLYKLEVKENGKVIWSTEAGTPHVGWNTIMYYLGEDGNTYLVQYQPSMFQNRGEYSCKIFSLEGGKQTIAKEYYVEFDSFKPITPEMELFSKEVGVILRNCYVLISTEQGIVADQNICAADLPQLYPIRFELEEINDAIENTLYPKEFDSVKADFPDSSVELLYASGAGGWGTYVTLNPDGSFTGTYSDSDMGSGVTSKTPNGTYYICDFHGNFTDIKQVSDYAWSMKLENLNLEKKPDQTWIEDGTQYISSEAWGIKDGEEFILYAPGTSADLLGPECRSWWPKAYLWRSGEIEEVEGWTLYNVNTGDGFFSE